MDFIFFLYQKTSKIINIYTKNLHLFSRNAWLFLFGTFFIGISFSGIMLLFNLYLKSIGLLEGRIGNVITVTTLGTLIMAIPASIAIKRFSIKKILIISLPVALLSYFIQVTISNYYIIMLGGLFSGISSVFVQITAAPFFMRNSTPKERPYLFSMNFAFTLVASVIGSIMGGFIPEIMEKYGVPDYLAYRHTLYIFGIFIIIALIPYLMIKENAYQKETESVQLKPDRSIIVKLFLPNFFVGLGAGLSIPFINLYFKNIFSMSTKIIGVYYSLSQVMTIIGLLIAPILAEKIGKIKTIIFSQLFSIPFLIILGITNNVTLAVVSFLIRAAMMNMAQPLFTNFAMESVKKEEQALTNALLVIAWSIGRGLSATIGGLLIEKYSYAIPFLTTGALYLISTILILIFFKQKEFR
ncbi:MAG: MFS transporter [bacterium]|nr:MFS transporter [bacterium]